jgi:hypothetical protein
MKTAKQALLAHFLKHLQRRANRNFVLCPHTVDYVWPARTSSFRAFFHEYCICGEPAGSSPDLKKFLKGPARRSQKMHEKNRVYWLPGPPQKQFSPARARCEHDFTLRRQKVDASI